MYKILILDENTYQAYKDSLLLNQKVNEIESPEELLKYVTPLLHNMKVRIYHERVTLRTLSCLVSSLSLEILSNISVELLTRGYCNLDYTNEIIVLGRGNGK